jgi:hypothetical protein
MDVCLSCMMEDLWLEVSELRLAFPWVCLNNCIHLQGMTHLTFLERTVIETVHFHFHFRRETRLSLEVLLHLLVMASYSDTWIKIVPGKVGLLCNSQGLRSGNGARTCPWLNPFCREVRQI